MLIYNLKTITDKFSDNICWQYLLASQANQQAAPDRRVAYTLQAIPDPLICTTYLKIILLIHLELIHYLAMLNITDILVTDFAQWC